jgi:bifunctional DNA-binding transcriptional regulator/antitoxin component of YhaV-PrlF toxin-antitoxin module
MFSTDMNMILQEAINMTVKNIRDNAIVSRKIISISSKRQLTIPLKYYETLGFDKEAECVIRGNELVIRPIKSNIGGEFAEQILEDLIEKGFSGEALLTEFKRMQKKIRPAVEAMLTDANAAAYNKGEAYSYEDIFVAEDTEWHN